MGGGLFGWFFGDGSNKPKPSVQDQFAEQERVLTSLHERLTKVDDAQKQAAATIVDAQREMSRIKIFGSTRIAVKSGVGALGGWPHDTTGEEVAEMMKSMQQELAVERNRVMVAQQRMHRLSQVQSTVESWTSDEEAKMRQLCAQIVNPPPKTS